MNEQDTSEETSSEGADVISLVERRQSKLRFFWQAKEVIELDTLTGKIKLKTDPWFAANVLLLICREELLRRDNKTWGKTTITVYNTSKPLVIIDTDGFFFIDREYIPDDETKEFWNTFRSVHGFDTKHKTDETKERWQYFDVAHELGECLDEWLKLGKPVPEMALSICSDSQAALDKLKELDEEG